MRKVLAALTALGVFAFSATAFAGVTVRYYNKDSQNYEWEAVCSGSKKTVKFGSSRTASVTIQGSGPCKVKTPNGEVELSGGENITIKNATITIN